MVDDVALGSKVRASGSSEAVSLLLRLLIDDILSLLMLSTGLDGGETKVGVVGVPVWV